MKPTIDLLTVQLFDSTWNDWTGTTASISIQRGGAVTVDVGTMTLVLVREDDPLADDAIVPGQPIRVVRYGTSNPIFTGVVQDADVSILRDEGGLVRNQITVVAVDAVASHAKNTRYGAVSSGGAGHETWVQRITRLATSSETPVSLPTEPDVPYQWECQDVAYTSSLASHFDLACQTVGANWYVDSSNVTRFRAPDDDTASVGTFSDKITDPHQYLDVVIDAGTKQVVNVLKVTNHGRGNDGNTYDVASTFEDLASIAQWGARAASTDMSVWDADTKLSGRVDAIFSAFADPVREVRQFVWDGQQNTVLAASLDIQSPVTVLYGDETFTSRIVGLTHDIGPSWWTITADLSTRGVPESQAVNDAYSNISADGSAPVERDMRAPQAPANLVPTSVAAWQGSEVVLAVNATWDAVTVGDNGAPIGVSSYELWARPNDGVTPTKLLGTSIGNALSVARPEFEIGDGWLVKVRAWSDNNVVGPFSAEESVTFAAPVEELDPPTVPSISTQPGLALAQWDGNLASDPVTPAPAALAWVLVEISDDDDAPDEEWAAVKTLYVAGDIAVLARPVGWEGFIRFRAVDRLMRVSDPSDSAPVTVPAAGGDFLDVSAVITSLVQAGIAGVLDLSANDSIELLAGRIDETQSVFRVTPSGAEVRQTGVSSYIELTAEALNLYGPAGGVGAQLTSQGLSASVILAGEALQVADFVWTESSDGHHLTLRKS